MNKFPELLTKFDFDVFHPDHVAEHYGLEDWSQFVVMLESELKEKEDWSDGITYELYSKWHIDKYSKLSKVLE